MHLGLVAAAIVLASHVAHGDSCAWGDRVEGRSLPDTPYKAWHVVSLDACKDLCCQDAMCASIDYVAGICRLHTAAKCDDGWSGAPSSLDSVHMDRGKCPFATPRNIAIIVGCSFAVLLTIGAGVFLKVKHSRYVHAVPSVVTSLGQPYRDGNVPETAPSMHEHVVEALDAEAAYSDGEVATESGDEAHEMASVVDAPEETTAPDAGPAEASPSPPGTTTRDESPEPASWRGTTPPETAPSLHVSVEVHEPVRAPDSEAAYSDGEVGAESGDEAHETASGVSAPEETTAPDAGPARRRHRRPAPAVVSPGREPQSAPCATESTNARDASLDRGVPAEASPAPLLDRTACSFSAKWSNNPAHTQSFRVYE